MEAPHASGLMWFRRDLRVRDNAGLAQALQAAGALHCAFAFDRALLVRLPRSDRRVEFLRDSAAALMPTCGGWAARGGAASRWPFRNGEDLQAAGITLGRDYPLPVVDHAQARTETLRRYAGVKAG